MFKISNNDFKILQKYKDFATYFENILQNVPRRDMYYKDKIRSIMYDLLDYIFRSSYDDNKDRLNYYYINIKSNIAFLDFMLDRLYINKYINENNLNKIGYDLVEINKMVTKWIKSKINVC